MLDPLHPILNTLAQIGLREKESLVYAALLMTGPNAITNVAKKICLPRSTTYNVIIYLLKKGILKELHKHNQHLYEATSPDKLLKYLHTRREKLDQQIQKMHTVIKQMNSEKYKIK